MEPPTMTPPMRMRAMPRYMGLRVMRKTPVVTRAVVGRWGSRLVRRGAKAADGVELEGHAHEHGNPAEREPRVADDDQEREVAV